MAFQKKTKQDEQNLLSLSIESREVREDDPLAPYRKHVDQFDLSEEQKLEFVQAMRAIVDALFDQHFKFNHLLLKDKNHENSVDCHVAYSNLEDGILNQSKEG
jgi:hypothetical protein